MTYDDVIGLLRKHQNERGIANWKKLVPLKLKSFGIGLTQLRKLAKTVGKDHDLALRLWKSDVYDAKVIGVLIDDPKKMTRAQAEAQVGDLTFWMFSHVYCSCDSALSRTPFARELAVDWAASKDHIRRRCGYLVLSELAKDTKDKALSDAFFEAYIDRVAAKIRKEENFVRDAMNGYLFGVGQRNLNLNKKAIAAARAIGPVEVDYGANSCEAVDVLKHLTGDHIQKKVKG